MKSTGEFQRTVFGRLKHIMKINITIENIFKSSTMYITSLCNFQFILLPNFNSNIKLF